MAYQRTRRVLEKMKAKREALVRAGAGAFAEKGYHAVTVQEIARRAGVATGTFYVYFTSKETLFLALIDSLAAMMMEAIVAERRREHDVLAKLRAAMRASLSVFAREEELARLILLQAPGAGKVFADRMAEIHDRFLDYVAADLAEAIREGLIPALDVRVAARAWLGSFYEVVMGWLQRRDPESLVDALPALISYNLRGIGAGWYLTEGEGSGLH